MTSDQRFPQLEFFPSPLAAPRVPAGDSQLVFRSEQDRAQQQRFCETKVLEGCIKGLREGCSLQAVRQCSPPGLLQLLGLAPQRSWEERAACQEACMAACLEQRQAECDQHAATFCAEAFAGPPTGAACQGQPQQAAVQPPAQPGQHKGRQ